MTTVFIEPCDVVFFRDDLPFGAVGMQVGRCRFPPRPSVIAGALRTKALASQGVDFDAFREGRALPEIVRREIGAGRAVGEAHALEAGSFRLAALHLGHRHDGRDLSWFRVGRDLVGSAAGAGAALRLLSPADHRVPGASSDAG